MRTLGIQIDGPLIRVAIVETEKNEVKIRALKSGPAAEPQDVKELYIPVFSGRTASAIASHLLIVRELELNIPKSRHFEEALAFQSQAKGHFKNEEVISVPQVIRQEGSKTQALFYTVPRYAIKECLQKLEKLGLDPENLSAAPLAILHYCKWKIATLQDAFLIHLGSQEWSCIWMENGHLKKSHAILGGNEQLLSALWEDRKKILLHKEVEGFAKQIDLLQLKAHLNPHLSRKLNQMRQELTKTLFSFSRESGPKPYFFTGAVDTFGHISEFLAESFKEAVDAELKGGASVEELKYAVPIGLGIEQEKKPLQLRQEEFFPRKNWIRSGSYALILILASLLLSGVLAFTGKRNLSSGIVEMKRKLSATLETQDPELKKELFSKEDYDVFYDWIQAVDRYSKEYPFILKAPRVAEVLSWISSHPLLKTLKQEGSPIIIRDFKYELVRFPKIGSLEEPYQARVEIEFETESPMSARKFHQALLKGDEWVDSKQEVGWDALNQGYRTTFFLKNRPKKTALNRLSCSN